MRRNKIALFITLAVLLVGGGLVYYLNDWSSLNVERNPNENTTETQEGVNYEPPTQEELEETEDFKEEQANEDNANQNEQNDENEEVTVTLTRVSVGEDVVTVAGYANSEVNGECKLTLTSSAEEETYTNPTEDNPTTENTVNCSTFRVPKNELSASSEWTAQITYTANGFSGISQEWDFSL